ncbi:putative reverse transcriptase domain-containing protein [Tanacetum coccineum]
MVLFKRKFVIVCHEKVVRIPLEGDEILQVHGERTQGVVKTLMNTKVEFRIDLVHGAISVAKSPYRLAPLEMQEFSEQLRELQGKVLELPRKEKFYAKFTKSEAVKNLGSTYDTIRDIIILRIGRACVIDFGGSWDVHLPLAKFSYNNSYRSSIRCALFESLYRRKCRSPVLWDEIGESSLIGPKLVQEMTDKVVLIKDKFKAISGHEVKSGLNVENGGSYGPFGLKEEVLGFQFLFDELRDRVVNDVVTQLKVFDESPR